MSRHFLNISSDTLGHRGCAGTPQAGNLVTPAHDLRTKTRGTTSTHPLRCFPFPGYLCPPLRC